MCLTESFVSLLATFHPVFTQPSYLTFQLLMTGWTLSPRHRYVTDLIVSSNSTGNGHFSGYHRFFSQAVWNIDDLWELLAKRIVSMRIGTNATIILAGNDTLCRKRCLGIFGTGRHHHALNSSKLKKLFHRGHDWANLCIHYRQPVVGSDKSICLANLHATVTQQTGDWPKARKRTKPSSILLERRQPPRKPDRPPQPKPKQPLRLKPCTKNRNTPEKLGRSIIDGVLQAYTHKKFDRLANLPFFSTRARQLEGSSPVCNRRNRPPRFYLVAE